MQIFDIFLARSMTWGRAGGWTVSPERFSGSFERPTSEFLKRSRHETIRVNY